MAKSPVAVKAAFRVQTNAANAMGFRHGQPRYAEAVRLALPQAPDYHVVPKAGHFDFLAPCSDALASMAPVICKSEPDFDRVAFHQTFNAAALDFFGKTLKNP